MFENNGVVKVRPRRGLRAAIGSMIAGTLAVLGTFGCSDGSTGTYVPGAGGSGQGPGGMSSGGAAGQSAGGSNAGGTTGGPQGGNSGNASGGASSGGSAGTSTSPDAPRILTLGTNTSTITPSDVLIISVVATDPDGIDDVIGGVVVDPTTSSSYGALQSAAAEGSYTLSLGWNAIDTVDPINAPPEGAQRVFRVQIFDTGGNMTSADAMVTLKCSAVGENACSGTCTILSGDDDNCGTCGHVCPSDGDGCSDGYCMRFVNYEDGAMAVTCGELCAGAGASCVEDPVIGNPGLVSGCLEDDDADLETCAERAPDSSCIVDCSCVDLD